MFACVQYQNIRNTLLKIPHWLPVDYNINPRLFTCDNDEFPYDQMVDVYNYAFKYIINSKNIP